MTALGSCECVSSSEGTRTKRVRLFPYRVDMSSRFSASVAWMKPASTRKEKSVGGRDEPAFARERGVPGRTLLLELFDHDKVWLAQEALLRIRTTQRQRVIVCRW